MSSSYQHFKAVSQSRSQSDCWISFVVCPLSHRTQLSFESLPKKIKVSQVHQIQIKLFSEHPDQQIHLHDSLWLKALEKKTNKQRRGVCLQLERENIDLTCERKGRPADCDHITPTSRLNKTVTICGVRFKKLN